MSVENHNTTQGEKTPRFLRSGCFNHSPVHVFQISTILLFFQFWTSFYQPDENWLFIFTQIWIVCFLMVEEICLHFGRSSGDRFRRKNGVPEKMFDLTLLNNPCKIARRLDFTYFFLEKKIRVWRQSSWIDPVLGKSKVIFKNLPIKMYQIRN